MEASTAFPHRSNPNPMSISTFNQHVLKPSLHRFMDFHGTFVQAWVVMILTLRRTKAPFRRAASSRFQRQSCRSSGEAPESLTSHASVRKLGGLGADAALKSIGPWLGVTYCHCFVFFIISIPWVARWHFWAH